MSRVYVGVDTLIFLHVLGMLGLFITMGIDWLSTLQLRQAPSIAVVRLWATIMSLKLSM